MLPTIERRDEEKGEKKKREGSTFMRFCRLLYIPSSSPRHPLTGERQRSATKGVKEEEKKKKKQTFETPSQPKSTYLPFPSFLL